MKGLSKSFTPPTIRTCPERRLLRYDFPVSAPAKRAEPHVAGYFVRLPVVHCEPRIGVRTGEASARFKYLFPLYE